MGSEGKKETRGERGERLAERAEGFGRGRREREVDEPGQEGSHEQLRYQGWETI